MVKDRVLIANRGEIALRIMEACEELGLDYVAVYTSDDKDSLHVKKAKKKYRISDYRDMNDLLAVADETGCTAIHPGYGFLAENYLFARRVVKRKRPLIFIGPDWEVIKNLGNKLYMKKVAKELGIPVIPGTTRPIYNEIEAEFLAWELLEELESMGFEEPKLLVKAVAGGGGMGIEEVKDIEEFRPIFRRVRAYAKRLFGDEGVIIEGKIPVFQHIEVQLLGSKKRELVHFKTRNCTIQTPFKQKRIEIAPGFSHEGDFSFDIERVEKKLVKYSIKLAKHFDYDSVGTWEWLVTPDGKYYLMEVNTRIQVENEISGKISFINGNQVNLIKEQIRVAFGERLGYSQKDIKFKGTAIELRLVAEDTSRGFLPVSGIIEKFDYPDYPWLTVRTHIPKNEPYHMPSQFDPNLALFIVYGESLAQAKERCSKLLEEIVIEGKRKKEPFVTNKDFLKENLQRIYTYVS